MISFRVFGPCGESLFQVAFVTDRARADCDAQRFCRLLERSDDRLCVGGVHGDFDCLQAACGGSLRAGFFCAFRNVAQDSDDGDLLYKFKKIHALSIVK